MQQNSEDWIEHIAEQVHLHYKGRKVVIWGSYGVADSIKGSLKEKFGIDTAFYVDGDKSKVDGKMVLSPEYLDGKSGQYYVVVPIAFYSAVKEQLVQGGYRKDIDYFYFCDCVLRQEADYYEDAHGNKIIGNYQGLKFAFSGFQSVIKIGEGVQFCETSIYLHNGVEVVIERGVQCHENHICLYNEAKIIIEDGVELRENQITMNQFSKVAIARKAVLKKSHITIGKYSAWEVKNKCEIRGLYMSMGEMAQVAYGDESMFYDGDGGHIDFEVEKGAECHIGVQGKFIGSGSVFLGEDTLLKVGGGFSIGDNYRITLNPHTSIIIGDDCMASYDVVIRSNDGHSIFDVCSKENINSSYEISRERNVMIGDHVWLGQRTVILYYTQIGDGSIIGANSLVKSKIPNNCIAVGCPAKVIKRNIAWSRKEGAEHIDECGKNYVHYTEEI